ncbi:MAG: leucine-rich repeat protein [Clostridia bacterium]|nr:leucine-rich repeat protein [Clostridia bacterium]
MKHCPHCKAELEDSARFCLNCMTSLQGKIRTVPPARRSLRPFLYRFALPLLLAGLLLFSLLSAQTAPDTPQEEAPATEERTSEESRGETGEKAGLTAEEGDGKDPSHSTSATAPSSSAGPVSTTGTKGSTTSVSTTRSPDVTKSPIVITPVPDTSSTSPTTSTQTPANEPDREGGALKARGTTGDCTWEMYGTVLYVFGGTHTGSYEMTDAPTVWGQATKIVFEEGVTHVGEEFAPFMGWNALIDIVIPNSLEYIGSSSLIGPWKNSLPDGLIYLDRFCFGYKGTSSATVRIREGTTQIVGGAFYKEKAIETVILPSGLKSIGFYAFMYCENLRTLYLPRSLTNVGYLAFDGCYIETIYYEGTEEEWKATFGNGKEAFPDSFDPTVYYNAPAP